LAGFLHLIICMEEMTDHAKKLEKTVSELKETLVSERKKHELEKEKIQNQLFQSQKLEAIGILAGGIAHDFNNILTVIKGHSDLAKKSVDKNSVVFEDLNEITKYADKAAGLTGQLLLFSRKHPMNIKSISLNMLKMLKRLIGEDIHIKTDLLADLWTINADESKIEQVIMNLSINVRDAMPWGGVLTIKTENVSLNDDYAELNAESYPGKFVRLSIQDNGIGMSEEVLQHLFEPFFTTKDSGKGIGLGMSVVYGIVKKHKGWTNVYSEPGKGTIFKIYIPAFLSHEKEDTVTKEKVEYHDVSGHGERILVVEDDEAIRRYVSKALSINGYTVFLAGTAQEALETYKKENKNFSLVLSDVILPDKTGNELVTLLQADREKSAGLPEIKVIFTSGYLDDKSQWEKIQEKGYKFLQKPFELSELLSAVKEVLSPQRKFR